MLTLQNRMSWPCVGEWSDPWLWKRGCLQVRRWKRKVRRGVRTPAIHTADVCLSDGFIELHDGKSDARKRKNVNDQCD